MKTIIYYWHVSLILVVFLTAGTTPATKGAKVSPTIESSLLPFELQQGLSQVTLSYPSDPTADIAWSAGFGGVADIQAAFNHARTVENSQLGRSIPMLTLPSQTTWNNMNNGEKALWLINRERIDRGVMALHGLEPNVNGVAQYYADFMLSTNTWGHTVDGRSPWERLNANPAIGACHDFLPIAENLAVLVTSGSTIPLPIERSIYMWMYDDGDCCDWGHRHAVLWYPYDDNSGPSGREGFLGIGRASGGPYKGSFSQSWPFAEIIVMNVFDPCATWVYSEPPGTATLISPLGTITTTSPTFTWNVSPDTDTTDPASSYYLWINGPSGNIFNEWYEASAICNGATCSITPSLTIGNGTHRWWIQARNAKGVGPWSEGMNFSLPTPGLPGKATLLSPSGGGAAGTPTYTWNEVPQSTWYYLWVNGPSGNVIKQWYTSAQASCNGSTCEITPAVTLSPGAYTWWIQTYNGGGDGPWSDPVQFTVPAPALPAKATLVSPGGSTDTRTPTYTWNEVSGSTWYYLWVNGPSGNVIKQWYTSAQAGCNGTTCSVTPSAALGSGTQTWWIQTYGPAGDGPWSDAMSFSITLPGLPGRATLLSPVNNIPTKTPTYTWNEVPGSTWYYLWVNGPSGNVIKQWYTSAQASCNGSTCAVTPGTTLNAGLHTWWIQTYNSAGDGPWSDGTNFIVP